LGFSFRSETTLGLLLCAAMGLVGAAEERLAFTSLAGQPVTLDLEQDGPGLVIHFWATWCPSCGEELPLLDAAAAQCSEDVVRVVAVNVGEDAERIESYVDELGLRLSTLLDPRGKVWRQVSGVGLPANFIWAGGKRAVDVGPRSAEQWAETFRSLGCQPTPETKTSGRG
jgi:thiol-disulfide isomerase/thioredoxin